MTGRLWVRMPGKPGRWQAISTNRSGPGPNAPGRLNLNVGDGWVQHCEFTDQGARPLSLKLDQKNHNSEMAPMLWMKPRVQHRLVRYPYMWNSFGAVYPKSLGAMLNPVGSYFFMDGSTPVNFLDLAVEAPTDINKYSGALPPDIYFPRFYDTHNGDLYLGDANHTDLFPELRATSTRTRYLFDELLQTITGNHRWLQPKRTEVETRYGVCSLDVAFINRHIPANVRAEAVAARIVFSGYLFADPVSPGSVSPDSEPTVTGTLAELAPGLLPRSQNFVDVQNHYAGVAAGELYWVAFPFSNLLGGDSLLMHNAVRTMLDTASPIAEIVAPAGGVVSFETYRDLTMDELAATDHLDFICQVGAAPELPEPVPRPRLGPDFDYDRLRNDFQIEDIFLELLSQ